MAKDPAMLWYWNDWHSGTVLMSRFLKGCYMDILHAQFNNGPLSLDEVKAVLGGDFGQSWPILQKKFSVNPDGLFFNDRLEQEKIKRKEFTESRRKNRLKKTYDTTYDKHMNNHMIEHMENENENRNKVKDNTASPAKKWNTKPAEQELSLELPEITEGAVIQQYRFTKNKVVTQKQVAGLWSVFKAQNFTGEKFYQSQKQVFSHFINWCKTQEIKDNQEPEKQGPQQSFELKRV